jgi:hypothetical protein
MVTSPTVSGQITAAGATRDVVFAEVDGAISSSYLAPIIADDPLNATIRIAPREGAKASRTS